MTILSALGIWFFYTGIDITLGTMDNLKKVDASLSSYQRFIGGVFEAAPLFTIAAIAVAGATIVLALDAIRSQLVKQDWDSKFPPPTQMLVE